MAPMVTDDYRVTCGVFKWSDGQMCRLKWSDGHVLRLTDKLREMKIVKWVVLKQGIETGRRPNKASAQLAQGIPRFFLRNISNSD